MSDIKNYSSGQGVKDAAPQVSALDMSSKSEDNAKSKAKKTMKPKAPSFEESFMTKLFSLSTYEAEALRLIGHAACSDGEINAKINAVSVDERTALNRYFNFGWDKNADADKLRTVRINAGTRILTTASALLSADQFSRFAQAVLVVSTDKNDIDKSIRLASSTGSSTQNTASAASSQPAYKQNYSASNTGNTSSSVVK